MGFGGFPVSVLFCLLVSFNRIDLWFLFSTQSFSTLLLLNAVASVLLLVHSDPLETLSPPRTEILSSQDWVPTRGS